MRDQSATPAPKWSARSLVALVVALIAVLGATGSPAVAQDEVSDDDPVTQLVERYAPIIMVKAQDGPCDPDGEPYGPTPIDLVLDNPDVVLRQVGNGDPVLKVAPGASDLFGLSEGFYVDFPGSALNPSCVYEQDFDRYSDEIAPTVYAHVIRQADDPDRLFVQYWFYWYFNDWNNKHESDWEGIVIEFDASSVEEALEVGPSRVGFAQHEGGERSNWDDSKLERDGDRPLVYSSAGSHASYYDSGLYLGRSASEGFGCDNTSGPSERLAPEVIVLPTEAAGADDPYAWLAFEGRWGERQVGPFNGPTGPASKERWLEPADWFDELRSSSVVIPASDNSVSGIIGAFCDVVEAGSGAFIRVVNSPGLVALGLGILFFLGRSLARRTEWSVVPATPVVARRRVGQILRTAATTYRRAPLVFITIGLICLPIAMLTGAIAGALASLPGIGPIAQLFGDAQGTNAVVSGFAQGVANALAVVLVNAVVAIYLTSPERGIGAVRAAFSRGVSYWRPLIGTYLRSLLIVTVLVLSIVGIPWAIRQLVRYQFASQSVVLAGSSGGAALRDSTRLVQGRWWHTAIVIGLISLTAAMVSVGSGLLLLIVVTGVPLWLFGVLYGVVYMLTLPLAGIAITLLYGDAMAEADEASAVDDADADPVSGDAEHAPAPA